MSDKPDDYKALADAFKFWWRELQSIDGQGNEITYKNGNKPRDRQALAQLRRINLVDRDGTSYVDVQTAFGIDAFRDLIRMMRNLEFQSKPLRNWLNPDDLTLEPFAIAAATLARVRNDTGGEHRRGATAQLLGAGFPKHPVFAEPRFKRLIRCHDDWPEFMGQARRIAAILERSAPVGDLGASIVLWNAESRIIQSWAFQYYKNELKPDVIAAIDAVSAT